VISSSVAFLRPCGDNVPIAVPLRWWHVLRHVSAGYSLDNLSLMALRFPRIRVDDAIVVLENITRYVERYGRGAGGVQRGAEIDFTVISMSVSLVAVFIPLLLMVELWAGFSRVRVTLSIAIGVSLLYLSPRLPPCAQVLRRRKMSATISFIAAVNGFSIKLW